MITQSDYNVGDIIYSLGTFKWPIVDQMHNGMVVGTAQGIIESGTKGIIKNIHEPYGDTYGKVYIVVLIDGRTLLLMGMYFHRNFKLLKSE